MTIPSYPTDVTDEQWAIIEPILPDAKHAGHRKIVNLREVVNAIF
jgi:transposase